MPCSSAARPSPMDHPSPDRRPDKPLPRHQNANRIIGRWCIGSIKFPIKGVPLKVVGARLADRGANIVVLLPRRELRTGLTGGEDLSIVGGWWRDQQCRWIAASDRYAVLRDDHSRILGRLFDNSILAGSDHGPARTRWQPFRFCRRSGTTDSTATIATGPLAAVGIAGRNARLAGVEAGLHEVKRREVEAACIH